MNSTKLTEGQVVACDMTGLGHHVIGTYVRPITVSKKYPLGGHVVRLSTGTEIHVSKTPTPSDGTLTRVGDGSSRTVVKP